MTSSSRKKSYTFGHDDIVIFGMITAGKLFTLSDEIFVCLHGDGTPFVGVVTFGNGYYGIALKEMLERATKSGFKVAVLGAFVSRHSMDTAIAGGRPDSGDMRKIHESGKKSCAKILGADYELHTQPVTNWSSRDMGSKVIACREEHPDEAYALPSSCKAREITDAYPRLRLLLQEKRGVFTEGRRP